MPPAFASAAATGPDLPEVLREVSERAVASLPGEGPPDAAFLFLTPDFGRGVADAGAVVRRLTGARHLLGCSGGGVIESGGEREDGRSAALLLARLPGVGLRPFSLDQEGLEGIGGSADTERVLGVPREPAPVFLLLADPFSLDGDALLEALNVAYPGRPALGGLASGGDRPGRHVLWLDDRSFSGGAAGFAVTGDVRVRPLVSQGCRPIGRRFVVTSAEGPRIRTLAGKPAAAALQETFAALPEADQALFRTNLHIGRVAHEARAEFRRGDFLIRNLMALVPEDGSIVVGDHVRLGQTVQFQLRDASTAREDLEALLDEEMRAGKPGAALVFSCGGRGTHLFGVPDHDLGILREKMGPVPMAGFFCSGEIGPVGPRNFLHGFTSSLALFG